MVCQELLERRVTFNELFVVDQRRVLAQLLADFRMTVEELVHVRRHAPVLPPAVLVLGRHERVRVLADFLSDSRVSSQILLQSRMALDELAIVEQRWILADLFRDFGMAVHERIHACHLAVSHIAVAIALTVFTPVIALFLMHHRIRVLIQLLAYFRMTLEILLQRGMVLDKLFVVHERRIFAYLFGKFRVTVEKLIETGKLPCSQVRVSIWRDRALRLCSRSR